LDSKRIDRHDAAPLQPAFVIEFELMAESFLLATYVQMLRGNIAIVNEMDF
jgi:hypothetical protein